MFESAGEGRGAEENSVIAEGHTCESKISTIDDVDAAAMMDASEVPFGAALVIAFDNSFETVCELKYGEVKPYMRFSEYICFEAITTHLR